MIREFFTGVRILGRGFGMWRTHPHLLAVGLIPAVIAFLLLVAAIVPLALSLGAITDWITPFADNWTSPWRALLRVGVGLVILAAAVALAGAVFTALTLTIGDPFYQRIWYGVERSLGGPEPSGKTGLWTTIGEGIRLIILAILVALLTLVIGFIPLVGGVLASVTGVVLSGRLIARELTARAFDARGLTTHSRSELLRSGRARVIGFGVATQLCFLVPLGAIVTMPAAVAGSTILARGLSERATATTVSTITSGVGAAPPPPSPPAHA